MKRIRSFLVKEPPLASRTTLFLFGAAEKGELCKPLYVVSLNQLLDFLGNPPENSEGIYYGIQTLLFDNALIYFRVEEEGFSIDNYYQGFRFLKKNHLKTRISAICMPGVGNHDIIKGAASICHLYRMILIMSDKDLYDYLTEK